MDAIIYYWGYPFVRYAILVGLLVALCSSLLGVVLVLKRYSFMGDGLSHVAFGAMAVATIFDISGQVFTLPATLITAVLLLKTGRKARIKGDAAIALLSVSSLAVGYFVMNVFSTSSNISGDVCSTLFGSTTLLTLTPEDVKLCVILSILVISAFVLFYNRIFAVTFDENFMTACGKDSEKNNLLISLMIAAVIVLGMNLVGSLLISALVIFPALSSMSIIDGFKPVVICSAVISVVSALSGMLISIIFSTPVGATIVICNLVIFMVCCLFRRK